MKKRALIGVLLTTCLQARKEIPRIYLGTELEREHKHVRSDIPDKMFSWSETGDIGKPYSTLIGERDIDNTVEEWTGMINITSSGRYYLTSDLVFDPDNRGVSCLKITASNVVLDLRGYSIRHVATKGSDYIKGIEVNSEGNQVSNVIIQNGAVHGMRGYGITVGFSCDHIMLKDLHVGDCNYSGIEISSATDVLLERVAVSRCDGSHAFAYEGAVGLRLSYAENVKVIDCSFNHNQQSGAANDGAGVFASGLTHSCFINCEAIKNQSGSSTGYAYGFRLNETSMHNCFENCTATHNTAQDFSSNCSGYGFSIEDSHGMTFLNCKSMGNKGVGATSYGFSCTGSSLHSMRFENCSAINNKGDSDAYGFYSESLEYSYFDQCVANNQRTTSVSSVTVAGFYSKGGEGLTFKNCIAFGNKANANVSDKAIGFCLDAYSGSGEMYSNIIGCQAKDNDGGTGTGYGIYLVSATACTIQKNELFVNHGITGGYGIKDDLTTGNVSAFMENIAYGNGTKDGMVINNYDIALSPNDDTNIFPVRIAFITDYTNLKTIRPLDNIELVEKADVSSL